MLDPGEIAADAEWDGEVVLAPAVETGLLMTRAGAVEWAISKLPSRAGNATIRKHSKVMRARVRMVSIEAAGHSRSMNHCVLRLGHITAVQ